MKYSEIFHSIQGEGALVGVPSVFFRTSFCNLRCVWCDTPYTSWEPEDRDITVAEAVEAILSFDCAHVVITGGEPFVQAEELTELCAGLADATRHVTIETNATVYAPVRADLISMSPKLANSNPPPSDREHAAHEQNRINARVIRQLLASHACQAKFVVDSPGDLDEIDALVESIPIPASTVILMPQGRTQDETQPKLQWLAEVCRKRGYRFSPRLHVDIWGDRRGV